MVSVILCKAHILTGCPTLCFAPKSFSPIKTRNSIICISSFTAITCNIINRAVSFPQVILALFVSAVSAGYIGAPAIATYAAAPAIATYAAAPAVVGHAPVLAAPAVASVVAPAPLAYAAPAVVKSPVLAAPYPLASSHILG